MNNLSTPVILVIDPDALTLTATSAILHFNKYEVHCAQDTDAAITGARDLPLDLIICDDQINDCDGPDLIEQIRALPQLDDVPVIYVSDHQKADVVCRTDQAGAVFSIKKPIAPDVLTDLVDKALWMPHLINNHVENKPTVDSQPQPNRVPTNHFHLSGNRESNALAGGGFDSVTSESN